MSVMQLKNHDIVCINLKTNASFDLIHTVYENAKKFFPKNEVLVLDNNMEIGVIREK